MPFQAKIFGTKNYWRQTPVLMRSRRRSILYSEAEAGNLSRIEAMIDPYLDGNDLEHASQQAWEIVEQLKRDEKKSLSP